MRIVPKGLPLIAIACASFLAFTDVSARAAGPVSGDLDHSGYLDIADCVALMAVVDGGTTMPTGAAYYADANQDDIIDANDVRYVLDAILGLSPPLPIVDQSAATSVSFWKATPPTQETQDGSAMVSVSFWIVRPPLPPTGEHTVLLGTPSFSRE